MPIEQDMALALFEPKIKDLTKDQFTVFMLGLIGRTYLNLGQIFDEDKVNLTLDELCDDLQKYNGLLTTKELELAFKFGYKKENSRFSKIELEEQFRKYGKTNVDFFGLSNATYFGWVNAYTWAENRLRVKKTMLDAKEKANIPTVKLSEQESDEILKQGVLKSFEDFKKGGVVFDSGNVKYNYLDKKGLITFTVERKAEILKQVEERLKAEALERKQVKETIKSALSKISSESVKSEAKKEALMIYFKQLVDMGAEISDLLCGL